MKSFKLKHLKIFKYKDDVKQIVSNIPKRMYRNKPKLKTLLFYLDEYLQTQNINLDQLSDIQISTTLLRVTTKLLHTYSQFDLKNTQYLKNDYVILIDPNKQTLLNSMSDTNDLLSTNMKFDLKANQNLRNARFNAILRDVYPGIAMILNKNGSDAVAFKCNTDGQIIDANDNVVDTQFIGRSIDKYFALNKSEFATNAADLILYIKNGEQKTHAVDNFTLDTLLNTYAEFSDIEPIDQQQNGLIDKSIYDMFALGLFRSFNETYNVVFTTNDLKTTNKFTNLIQLLRDFEQKRISLGIKYPYLGHKNKTRRSVYIPLWMFCANNDVFYFKTLLSGWNKESNGQIELNNLIAILTDYFKLDATIIKRKIAIKIGVFLSSLIKSITDVLADVDKINDGVNGMIIDSSKLIPSNELLTWKEDCFSLIKKIAKIILEESTGIFTNSDINIITKGLWVNLNDKFLNKYTTTSSSKIKRFYRSSEEESLKPQWKTINKQIKNKKRK